MKKLAEGAIMVFYVCHKAISLMSARLRMGERRKIKEANKQALQLLHQQD
jgi:hypothetical protein